MNDSTSTVGARQAGGTLAAHAAMLAFSFLISTSFTVGAVITRELDPVAVTTLRFLWAALLFAPFVIARGVWRLPRPAEALQSLLLGLPVGIYFVAMFEALRRTNTLATGALFALMPLMTALISRVLLGQRLSPREVVSLLLAASGAVWVVFGGSLERMAGFHIGSGELIMLGGSLAYAFYSPAIRLLDRGTPGILVSFWTIVAGTLLIGVYGAPTLLAADWLRVPLYVYAGILHLALVTTVISVLLIQYASLRLPQAKVMAYTYLTPGFILLTEGLVHGSWPSLSVIAGVAVIAAAMLVLQAG